MKKIGVLLLISVSLIFIGCKTVPEGDTTMAGDPESAMLMAQLDNRQKVISDLQQKIDAIEKTGAEKSFLEGQLSGLMNENSSLRQALNNEQEKANTALNEAKKALQMEIDSGDVDIFNYNGVIVIHVRNTILFDPNQAEVKEQNKPTLLKIAGIFDYLPDRIIRVEGHTATGPDVNYPSSWELGSARAVNVVRFFQNSAGIDPAKMVAVSFGEYRPIANNDSEEGKVINRRIEIVLINRPLYQWQELLANK